MKFNRRLSMLAISAAIALSGTLTFADNALDRVMKNGVLKVATDANWAPQSFLNDKNEMDGFDVAVAREIATRLGVEVEFVTPSWDIITAGNWSGRWDMSVGSMTPTVSRAEVLSFPEVYYYTPASIAVHADSPYQNVGDLNTPGELRSYKDGTAALDDLRLGDGVRINAMVGSLPAILAAIESGYPVRVLGEPVFYEPLAVAIDRGDAEFNNKVAGIVRKMKEDGTLKALSQKWYGIDYTTPVE